MQRAVALALGVVLIFLAFGGVIYHAPIWLAWLDGLAGLVAFGVAGAFGVSARAGAALSGVLALGLVALWLAGLTAGGYAAGSMPWWNFGAACAAALLAISGAMTRESERQPRQA
jgi:hypothetical protein